MADKALASRRGPEPIFYGWRVVHGCFVVAVVAWTLGLFGLSVFLHAVHASTGLSISLISSAITLSFLVGAFSQVLVGSAVVRFGPRTVISFGALAMAAGVAGMGHINAPWHVYAVFLTLGVGWTCLSTTALTTTLAPWFDRHQGRAISTAMMGASLGGMIAAPALLFGITHVGLAATGTAAAVCVLIVILPIALVVFRRGPQDMGLFPDGEPPRVGTAATTVRWTRAGALRTPAFWSVVVTFGLGLFVQLGFLTHHVTFLLPALGAAGASATVTATGITALLGRFLLARFSDRIDVRVTTSFVLLVAAASFALMALFPAPAMLVAVSIVFGLTVGNVTTLSPIIVRREFGAASFGAIFGIAAAGTQLISALGPTYYGVLYDRFGSYGPALLIAAGLDVLAAAIVFLGGRKPLRMPE